MTQRQRHKTDLSENISDHDDDRPRSILKPVPLTETAVRSSRPTFAQGLYDLILSADIVITVIVVSLLAYSSSGMRYFVPPVAQPTASKHQRMNILNDPWR